MHKSIRLILLIHSNYNGDGKIVYHVWPRCILSFGLVAQSSFRKQVYRVHIVGFLEIYATSCWENPEGKRITKK